VIARHFANPRCEHPAILLARPTGRWAKVDKAGDVPSQMSLLGCEVGVINDG
jgi:hypothetical protein